MPGSNSNHSDLLSRESELFEKLIDTQCEIQREAILHDECGDDPDLQQHLRDLLAWHLKIEPGVLDTQNLWPDPPATEPEISAGDHLGSYKILQLIGTGGMGKVYMAEQRRPIRRKVALKVLHSHISSRNVLARFEAERVALSRMDHPNVMRVLDAGETPGGRHYFIMELVLGCSITEFCDREQIGLRERLELFVSVCQAIHHAHQRGILHRDIKPSNILVVRQEGIPSPKVIDFGIAKALDSPLVQRTMFTRFGELIGTPEYMSPEQIENGGLDLDVRSDVYSLGVLLYELMLGVTPFRITGGSRLGLLKTLETLRDREATRPSLHVTQFDCTGGVDDVARKRQSTANGLQKFLRGDLDWVILRALSKDRNERYDSASAFGKDIQRFLQNEPVEAAAQTFSYCAKKVFQKYKTTCVTAGLVVASLLVSTALSLYWAISADRAASRLQTQSLKLENQNSQLQTLERRASQAEKRATSLARERQNDAAVTRAVSRYLFDAIRIPKRRALASLAAAEIEMNVPMDFNPRKVVTAGKFSPNAVVTELPAELGAQLIEQIGKAIQGMQPGFQFVEDAESSGWSLVQVDDVPIPDPGDPLLLDRFGEPSDAKVKSVRKVEREELLKERLILRQLIEEEQQREFGDSDPIVAETLLEIGELHLELKQADKAILAFHKTLAIFGDDEEHSEKRSRCLSHLEAVIKK